MGWDIYLFCQKHLENKALDGTSGVCVCVYVEVLCTSVININLFYGCPLNTVHYYLLLE